MEPLFLIGMKNPAHRAAYAAWMQLDGRRRRQVLRAANRRRLHPDPRVATIAAAWATAVLATSLRTLFLALLAIAVPIVAIVGFVVPVVLFDGPNLVFPAAGSFLSVVALSLVYRWQVSRILLATAPSD